MVPTRSYFFRAPFFRFMVRYARTNSPSLSEFEVIKPKFNNTQQEQILSILNQNSTDQLLSLNVSQSKIRNLENYKKKNGPFKSLDDLLEVDGLGVKVLEKLCKQLITEPSVANVKKSTNGNNKKLKNFLVPSLPLEMNIFSTVGINLAPMGVSWVKLLHSGNKLECWGYQDFTSLPKKMLPIDTFQLAVKLLNKLPVGDVYVFEGSSSMGLQGQKQPSTVTSYTQHLELSSMLVALINTSSRHNNTTGEVADEADVTFQNKVYFLRSKLPARLFKTLVGNECVSSTDTVLQLLESSVTNDFKLPCSPINVESKLKNEYLTQPPANKELLGQALMLAVTFINLCVTRNSDSIQAVAPRRR